MADIVVFRSTSPSVVCAAQFDPVVAEVLYSNPEDVWMTIVDGKVRKAEYYEVAHWMNYKETRWEWCRKRDVAGCDHRVVEGAEADSVEN